jgi:hypothetical protein
LPVRPGCCFFCSDTHLTMAALLATTTAMMSD